MNTLPSFLSLIAILASGGALLAQDEQASGIRVTTTLHEDGSKVVTTTDPENHTSEALTYDAGGKFSKKIVYTLDDQQHFKTGTVYSANGVLQYQATYTISSGRVQEEQDYSPDGRLLGRFVYHYDAKGKVVKIDSYDANGNLITPNGATPDQKHGRNRH